MERGSDLRCGQAFTDIRRHTERAMLRALYEGVMFNTLAAIEVRRPSCGSTNVSWGAAAHALGSAANIATACWARGHRPLPGNRRAPGGASRRVWPECSHLEPAWEKNDPRGESFTPDGDLRKGDGDRPMVFYRTARDLDVYRTQSALMPNTPLLVRHTEDRCRRGTRDGVRQPHSANTQHVGAVEAARAVTRDPVSDLGISRARQRDRLDDEDRPEAEAHGGQLVISRGKLWG